MKKGKVTKIGGVILAAAVLVTGVWSVNRETDEVAIPQMVEFVDTDDGSTIILEEETPLAKATVKVKKTKKKTVKKNKLKQKAKKTTKKTTRKTSKKKTQKESSTQKIQTDTTVLTTVQSATKKNSKIQTVTTTVQTTVKTTTTNKPKMTKTAAKTTTKAAASSKATQTSAAANKTAQVYNVAIRNVAPKAHSNVLSAYELLGFTTEVNSTVAYSGYFGVKEHKIILQQSGGNTAYHELGHFVGWIAGNLDTKSEFVAIYNAEKGKMTGSNTAYLTKNSSEYFAESYKDYVLNPSGLKSSRPQTYSYIEKAVNKVTTARAATIKTAYDKAYWA